MCLPKGKSSSQWYEIKDWLKADFSLYQTVLNKTLQKINVPYNLLQANVQRNIPARKTRKHTEIPGFSKNQELMKACQDAKFWFSVWREGGRPKSGVLNCRRKHTKRKFEKALKQHRTKVKDEYTERIINDPSRLWKDHVKYRQETPKSMPCDPNDWRAYYTSEFSAADPSVARPCIEQLESMLSNLSFLDFTVTVSDVTANAFKLKKRKLRGVDGLSCTSPCEWYSCFI